MRPEDRENYRYSTGAQNAMKNKFRKFLVICGGHKYKSVKKIKKKMNIKRDFFVHTFEPCDVFFKSYRHARNHKLHKKAVWVYDGATVVYMSDNRESQGHSLLKEKDNVNIHNHIEVECIDFGRWLKETFDDNDYVAVRMDIEGAEFEVLNHIIEDGSINRIGKLLVEFHHRKYPNIASEEDYINVLSRIKVPFEEIPH